MLQSLISLLPTIGSTDGDARHHRRGGRSRRRQHAPPGDAGKWIWIDGPDAAPNSYLYARKTFALTEKPSEAFLKTTADSKYRLFVNGNYVGKGPVRNPEGIVYYDTYDITQHLVKGKNVIAFLVHYIGENTYSYKARRAGLLCKAEIKVGDEMQTVVTDETWKVRRAEDWTNAGARLSRRLGFQEVYDASSSPGDWRQVKFSERGWQDAVVVGRAPGEPWGDLYAREIPPLREEKILPRAIIGAYNSPDRLKTVPPAEIPDIMADAELAQLRAGSVQNIEALLTEEGNAQIKTPRSNRGVALILDFGREVFGNVEIGIADSGTGCIDLGYGELLEDGRVKPNKAGVKYTDRVLLKRGRLEWQGFESRAFRYLQVEFRWCSRPVVLEYIRVNQTTYPVQQLATFECSDSLLNEIWKIGAYTTQLCMEDTFIDCPWRERAQWWGDARIEARAAYYAFNDTQLLAQGLRQLARSQTREGWIAGMYPAGEEKLLPDYSLLWIFSLLDYYAFSDDVTLLKDLYPNVKRLLEWFKQFEGEFGLLTDVPGWLFIDWAELEKEGQSTALNCLYYQGLQVAGVIATVAGHPEEASEYVETSHRLKRSINKYLYSPIRGLYADARKDGHLVEKYSRQTNILAALFDIPDHYRKSTIYRQALNGSLPEIITPYFMSFMLEALYAGEKHDEALSIIRKKWGAMVKAGATAFWEQFSEEASLCHGWSACPTRDLLAEYVGIKPVLGAHRFAVTPHTGGMRWARGSINTRTGRLAVEWRVVRNSLTINVEVPEDLRVDVYAPGTAFDTRVSVDGKAWPSKFVTLGPGSHRVRVTALGSAGKSFDYSPKPPVAHVQVLENVSQLGRRREAVGRRQRRRPEKIAQVGPAAQVKPEELLEATVEAVVDTEPGLVDAAEVQETAETAAGAAPEVKTEKKSHRRSRRRGGRGRSRSTAEAQQAEAPASIEQADETATEEQLAVETLLEAQVDVAPVESEEPREENAEPEIKSRRRPRRRGGRGRSRSTDEAQQAEAPTGIAEAAEDQPVAEAVLEAQVDVGPAEPVESSEESAEPETKSRRRPRRRGGRSRSKSTHSEQEPQAGAESVEAQAETPQDEAQHTEPSQTEAHHPEPQPESSSAPEATEEKPARKRRTYTRRGGGRRKKSQGTTEATETGETAAHTEPATAAEEAGEQ